MAVGAYLPTVWQDRLKAMWAHLAPRMGRAPDEPEARFRFRGGTGGEALRVTGQGTQEGGITYYPAVRKTWAAGVIGEGSDPVWVFNWQDEPMDVGDVYEPATPRGSLVVGANPPRPVYSYSKPHIVCINGVAFIKYD